MKNKAKIPSLELESAPAFKLSLLHYQWFNRERSSVVYG